MGVIVKCNLPNASERISGVTFTRQPDGAMWSEEIEVEAAERFRSIPAMCSNRRREPRPRGS